MSQKNQIYYTTAQVTDMVELSDQNVRKYVRMLEERGYEVAKDEHQRRLFSQNDVQVLNEMIRISKTPGFTLELAADEVMNTVEEIISQNEIGETDPTSTNDDVLRALEQVLQKLEDMRQENIILRKNVSSLVTRLEDYDNHILEVSKEQKLLSNQVEEIKDNRETSEEPIDLPVESTEEREESVETLDDSEITEDLTATNEPSGELEETEETVDENTDSEKSNNVDMSAFEDPVEAIEVPEEDQSPSSEERNNSAIEDKKESSSQEMPKKKGFFARLFGG